MKELMKVKNAERKNIKIYVEQVATLTYRDYGIFKDDDGNLYYQFTDDCAEIEKCATNDLKHEIEKLENQISQDLAAEKKSR